MPYKLESCGFLAQFGTLTRSSESMTEMTNTHTQREVGIRQPGASVGNAEPPPQISTACLLYTVEQGGRIIAH